MIWNTKNKRDFQWFVIFGIPKKLLSDLSTSAFQSNRCTHAQLFVYNSLLWYILVVYNCTFIVKVPVQNMEIYYRPKSICTNYIPINFSSCYLPSSSQASNWSSTYLSFLCYLIIGIKASIPITQWLKRSRKLAIPGHTEFYFDTENMAHRFKSNIDKNQYC